MTRKLILSLVLVFTVLGLQAQHSIKGTLKPFKGYSYALLYQIDGIEQRFIGNTSLLNGSFELNVTADREPGMYRVVFDLQKGVYLDVFYNKEDINFSLDPSNPEFTVQFSSSKSNEVYYKAKLALAMAQNQLDQFQVAYLKDPSDQLKSQYMAQRKAMMELEKTYLDQAKGLYCEPFVKALLRSNPEAPVATGLDYLNYVRNHYFDHIDFSDKTLLSSDLLYNKVSDFIFYLNYSDDLSIQSTLYKKGIYNAMKYIDSESFRATMLELIISQFESQENLEMVEFVVSDYYAKLPYELQDNEFIKDVRATLATAVGNSAPDFSWTDKGQQFELNEVVKDGMTILVFWSSTCGHCLNDIPALYAFLKDYPQYQVVAVGLEEYDEDWKELTAKMPEWHQVYGAGKWENPIARSYNIIGTPTYFILDTTGVILAKPGNLENLQALIQESTEN
ncbi:MAG: TlpA family protein disulfide reductase [Flavobacteriaceae bacterium]